MIDVNKIDFERLAKDLREQVRRKCHTRLWIGLDDIIDAVNQQMNYENNNNYKDLSIIHGLMVELNIIHYHEDIGEWRLVS